MPHLLINYSLTTLQRLSISKTFQFDFSWYPQNQLESYFLQMKTVRSVFFVRVLVCIVCMLCYFWHMQRNVFSQLDNDMKKIDWNPHYNKHKIFWLLLWFYCWQWLSFDSVYVPNFNVYLYITLQIDQVSNLIIDKLTRPYVQLFRSQCNEIWCPRFGSKKNNCFYYKQQKCLILLSIMQLLIRIKCRSATSKVYVKLVFTIMYFECVEIAGWALLYQFSLLLTYFTL